MVQCVYAGTQTTVQAENLKYGSTSFENVEVKITHEHKKTFKEIIFIRVS
jgi:hypothetical protein